MLLFENIYLNTVFYILITYLVGSVPSALIIGKLVKGVDVRDHGSGNLGGTNSVRVLGKAGYLVIVYDVCVKGLLMTSLAMNAYYNGNVALHGLLIGLAAGVGHMFPVFAGFKGGKGVATNFGIIWGYRWYFALGWFLTFLGIIKVTKYVSLGSLITIFGIGVTLFLTKEFTVLELVIYYLYVALVFFMHRANIGRLIKGEERKIGQNKERV